MANLAVSKSWTTEILYPADLNGNFSDVVNYINARNGGSTAWDALNVTGTSTLTGAVTMASTLAVTGAITATGGIVSLFGYRRPNLVYSSATAVNVENNTGTSNQTTIVFPDGTVRSVTEDVASTHKYRQFLITATAEFTTGTEDSGLYTGLSETTNTWYAIYAVKSAINTNNFVLVGTTTLPLQANFTTLNSNLGTNGWVYLGLIRNGDNSGATGDILSFTQCGALTLFNNAMGADTMAGTLLASNSSTTSTLTYTRTSGTGTTDIPNHIKLAGYAATVGSNNATSAVSNSVGNTFENRSSSPFYYQSPLVDATKNINVSNSASTSRQLSLATFYDSVLAAGINPIL